MRFLREHWFDLGIVLAAVCVGYLLVAHPAPIATILWVSLISLFFHQFEEYRYPGYFPGTVNSALFKSQQPDRYPLNQQTSLIVNVVIGWGAYVAAALFNQQAIWLGIATIMVSLGNVLAHTALFNVRGKTWYNPGMLTALLLFLPIAIYFLTQVVQYHAASALDWVVGIVLGVILNYIGILKLIDWLKDPNSPYRFPARSMLLARKA